MMARVAAGAFGFSGFRVTRKKMPRSGRKTTGHKGKAAK